MIKIIVDSTCDLPKELFVRHDLKMLPLRVLLEETEYLDKVTIRVEEVYQAMRRGILPLTSQPSPQEMYDAFRSYCLAGVDFIFLSFSAALSGTCQLAQSVMKELKDQFPAVQMRVVDSKAGSTATGLIALKAAELCEAGVFSFEEMIRSIQQLVAGIEHVFTISDLSWLIKDGRIGRTQGMVGNLLKINPLLYVNDGRMEVIEKVRGRKRALNRMVELLEDRGGGLTETPIGVSHADDPAAAEELVALVEKRLGKRQFIVNQIGSVLGSHLGIGGVGLFFFNGKTDFPVDDPCRG